MGMHSGHVPGGQQGPLVAGKVAPSMDVVDFCQESHVIFVAGKGGVGKTTVSATLATMAAEAGMSVLAVALDDSTNLGHLLGITEPLSETAIAASPRLSARTITADAALLSYLDDHGMARVSKKLVSSGALEVVSTAIPGIREVLVLARLKQLERDRTADLIVVDAPATGHAVSFLTSPAGLVASARGGPLRSQANDVVEMLNDPTRCQVILVTIAEETPVNEAAEAAYRLEDEAGVALGPIIINALLLPLPGLGTDPKMAALAAGIPEPSKELSAALSEAARFRLSRIELQTSQMNRLGSEIALPTITLPYLAGATIDCAGVKDLAKHLSRGIEALADET